MVFCKTTAIALTFFLLCHGLHARQSELLSVDGTKSIHDLGPWLSVQINNQWVKFTYVRDSLKVQHPYTFELRLKNTTSEEISYHLVFGSEAAFADLVLMADSTYAPTKMVVVNLDPSNELTIQFRLPELDRMNTGRLQPQLLTPTDFLSKENGKIFQPFFLGIFLFMVFFNAFYFLISQWTVYLKYAVYILLSLVFFTYYFGFLHAIFPGLISTSNNLVWILSSSIAAAYTIFISDFGEFKKLNPKAHRIFQIVLTFKYIQLPTEAFLWLIDVDFIHSRPYMLAVMGFEVPLVLLGFYYLIVSPFLRSRIIFVASFILLSGSVVGQLNPFPNIDRMVIIEVGTLIEIMIFSISLALKAKEIDKNRIQVTQQLLEQTRENIKIQERISADLEREVKERTLSLEKKNLENELLMIEIHHRVKNNLQIISSLINLKSRQAIPETNEVLQQLNHRIFSMGLVYEKLHQSRQLNQIRLDEYLMEIGGHLTKSFEENKQSISLKLNCEPITMDPERVLACGLIANELVTNSIKYAFDQDQQDAEIYITLAQEGGFILYQISDNGRKKPSHEKFRKSFGLRFVEQLVVTKLKGVWTTETNNGFHVVIKFSIDSA